MLHSFEWFNNYSFSHTSTACCILLTLKPWRKTAKYHEQFGFKIKSMVSSTGTKWRPDSPAISVVSGEEMQPVAASQVLLYHWSKIEICSQSAPLLPAKQDERRRGERERERERERKWGKWRRKLLMSLNHESLGPGFEWFGIQGSLAPWLQG